MSSALFNTLFSYLVVIPGFKLKRSRRPTYTPACRMPEIHALHGVAGLQGQRLEQSPLGSQREPARCRLETARRSHQQNLHLGFMSQPGTVDSNWTRWRTRKVVVLFALDGSDVKFYTIAASLIVPM